MDFRTHIWSTNKEAVPSKILNCIGGYSQPLSNGLHGPPHWLAKSSRTGRTSSCAHPRLRWGRGYRLPWERESWAWRSRVSPYQNTTPEPNAFSHLPFWSWTLGDLEILHFTTVLSIRSARSDESVVKSTGGIPAPRTEKEWVLTLFKRFFMCSLVFDDSLSRQTSIGQSLLTLFQDRHHFGSLWWHSFKTAIARAVFDDTHSRQPSLRQSLVTLFQDSHHLGSLWWQCFAALLKRTLRSRFRQKNSGYRPHKKLQKKSTKLGTFRKKSRSRNAVISIVYASFAFRIGLWKSEMKFIAIYGCFVHALRQNTVNTNCFLLWRYKTV